MNKFKNKYPFKNRNHIIRGDWWDLNFFGDFLNSKSKLKDQLNERTIRFSNETAAFSLVDNRYLLRSG